MSIFDWKEFWNEYPRRAEAGEHLKQVGKTVGGQPITEETLSLIVEGISASLELQPDDRVLDLCCGNGLLTRQIAPRCKSAVGIDFSEPLIETAKKDHGAENIEYRCLDVRKLGTILNEFPEPFTKVMCYEALAFLEPEDLDALLAELDKVTVENPIILFGSVLDKTRRWNFFNTLRRKVVYMVKIVILKREVGLGRWWKPSEVQEAASRQRMQAKVVPQDSSLHTAHYRFDIKLTRANPS